MPACVPLRRSVKVEDGLLDAVGHGDGRRAARSARGDQGEEGGEFGRDEERTGRFRALWLGEEARDSGIHHFDAVDNEVGELEHQFCLAFPHFTGRLRLTGDRK